MALLFGLCVVFMAVAYLVQRPWTVALPFAIWLGVYVLGATGLLSDRTSLESALMAAVLGALFAVAGLIMGRGQARRQPRS